MSNESNGPDDMLVDWAALVADHRHEMLRHFDSAWDQLADVALVDDRGGAEYRSRRLAWLRAGMPQPIRDWIVAQAQAEYEYVQQLERHNPKTGGGHG